jgi:hypothetical protein
MRDNHLDYICRIHQAYCELQAKLHSTSPGDKGTLTRQMLKLRSFLMENIDDVFKTL